MSKLFYNVFLFLYSIGIRVAALWNPKARKWVGGRGYRASGERDKKLGESKISDDETGSRTSYNEHRIDAVGREASDCVWMHCASLGEFEQGRPVLEAIKAQHPNTTIILTFFSPSGYEAVKGYKNANHIFYLPMDNYFAAKRFISVIRPTLVLWVKYEFWYYYLSELKRRNIPVLLVSGIFRKNQPFFKWYGGIWKEMLQCFQHLFVQNESSRQLLSTIGIEKNVSVNGDTRFDRVLEIAKAPLQSDVFDKFCGSNKIVVAGSTWEDDEVILAAYADETNYREKFIIVPHELDTAHIDSVKKVFKKSICYSEVQQRPELAAHLDEYQTFIIDTVGLLSRLYNYGYINYVGGGFTADGIHNILEAAVWGKPIIIGENYQKYFEAVDLVNELAAESISNTNELKKIMNIFLNDAATYKEAAAAAKEYVYKNGGAAVRIEEYIKNNALLK